MFVSAQNQPDKYISILRGRTHVDTMFSFFQPIYQTENCQVILTSLGNRKYRVTIQAPSSNPNYVGNAKLVFQYTSAPPIKPYYLVYHINFVPSVVATKDNFISYFNESPLTVSPLNNDTSTDSTLYLRGLAKVEGGVAAMAGNDVSFTPAPNVNYGKVLYSVVDSMGVSGAAMIHFIRTEATFPTNDTIRITLINSRSQYVALPAPGFTMTTNPSKGSVQWVHDQVLYYTPSEYASGLDQFTLVDGNGNTRLVQMTLLSKQVNRSSVKDDVVYTTINNSVSFNVLSNDLSSNFPITQYSPDLVAGSSPGHFTYSPPQNFTGVKNFTYTVNYGNYQAIGKISVYVGNFQPQLDKEYSFAVYNHDKLVLNYDVPVAGYEFELSDAPFGGDVTILHDSLMTDSCGSYYSKAHVIYTPAPTFFGSDSFSVQYCVTGAPCEVVKVYVQVNDGNVNGDCHCVGPDCVWSGDLNGDGIVSVNDVVALGRFFGSSGPVRDEVSFPFRAGQYADDWTYLQPNGKNSKHIDANGDGWINVADTMSISNQYGKVSRLVPDEILAIKEYPFELRPNQSVVDSGDLLELEILLGNETQPIVDVFGLAFELPVNPGIIDSSSLRAEFYANNWFSQFSPTISMVKQPKEGQIHVGYTRTLGIVEDEVEGIKPRGSSGSGAIGKLMFIVEDEVEGIRSDASTKTYRIKTENIVAEDADGNRFRIPDAYTDIRLRLKKSVPTPTADKLLVFPNPASEQIQLYFNGRNLMKEVVLFDCMGKEVYRQHVPLTQDSTIDVSVLGNGLYHLQVHTDQGIAVKKVMIFRP